MAHKGLWLYLEQSYECMILYRTYAAAIFFRCHPYIWSTPVLHDWAVSYGFPPNRIKEDFSSGVVGPIHFLVAQPSGCLALVSECMYRVIIFLQMLH